MRINTNIASLNTQRVLTQTNNSIQQSIGRLSSGFRINRAGDDAAGLGIANQMRADLRAMGQASRNAEQATSSLQIAEGSAETISNIVDRMKELAAQSASDNTSEDGRAKIQSEFTQLQDEITRIVNTTKFQGATLLDGSWASSSVTGADDALEDAEFTLDGAAAGDYKLGDIEEGDASTDHVVNLEFGGQNYEATIDGNKNLGDEHTLDFSELGVEITVSGLDEQSKGEFTVESSPVTFMVSVSGNQDADGEIGDDNVSLGSLDLSLETLGLDGTSLDSKADAQAAIGDIDKAISKISNVFGDIGAAQNRIEHALTNVRTSIENVAAAESTIRDADMAAEMAEFTRNQILQQVGTAMLAQANMAPQSVLQLLQ